MGLALLSKVSIISPRSEYEEVAKKLAQFEDFHPIVANEPDLDPKLQELSVKAVRLYAQADQAAKDLAIALMPGTIDILFRGAKIPTSDFDADSWEGLLDKADAQLNPIVEEIKTQRALLLKIAKEEADINSLRDTLRAVAGFAADIGDLSQFMTLKVALVVVQNETVAEFKNSLPGSIFVSQALNQARSLVLVASEKSDQARIEKTLKAFDLKPLSIPGGLPQNPAEAYRRLTHDSEAAGEQRTELESRIAEIRERQQTAILAVRELADMARETLDQTRVSGPMKRFATISGYVPRRREAEFKDKFGKWMVSSEPVPAKPDDEKVPTLLENPTGVRTFQLITREQGTPGREEVDPTPLISFVFPVFFGMMFGDFGHGIILTLAALLIRQRGTGSLRQWGNIFLAAGISATIFGAIFGEFFGLSLHSFLPIPPLLEILQRPLGANPTVNTVGIETVMVIAILIGIAHVTTGLALDIYETTKTPERWELVAKIPTLTMYISGICYGIAFIGAGYNFNVLTTSAPAPCILQVCSGVPNNLLGGVSLAVLVASMVAILSGRGIAIKAGKMHGESAASAFADGGLEVFERISQFLSNTISYVRLAIMLLVHAVLLLIVNEFFPITNPVMIAPWVLLNLLVLTFEAFVVYVQDLRLHIYEFFTKFFRGTGMPFKKIVPDRVRIRINWS